MERRELPAQRALKRERLALLVSFIISRGIFYAVGVSFDLRPLATSWQILDPVLLRDQLLESTLFMAGQPPLYNVMLGAVLKLSSSPSSLALSLRGVYAALSLLACVCLHTLLHGLRAPAWLRMASVLLFMLSPALVLYENIPYYTLHEVALLTLTTLLFQRLLARFSVRRALALFAVMAVLVYTRSLFQLYWLLALAAYSLWLLPAQRKQLLLALAAPLLLVVALYAKNWLVVGHFGSSHWLGLSATKLSTMQLPRSEREELVGRGALSPLALGRSYETPEKLHRYFSRTPKTGHAVLDQGRKSTGHINYNALPYVAVARDSMRDARYATLHFPRVYLQSVAKAWLLFLRPSSDYPFLYENRLALRSYSRAYAALIAGQPIYPEKPEFDYESGQVGYLLAAGYLAAVCFGGVLLVRCWRRRNQLREALAAREQGARDEALLVFMWLNVMYVSVIGNAFEIDENQRFRFSIHPLLIGLLCVLSMRVYWLWQRRAQRERNCSADSPSASIQR